MPNISSTQIASLRARTGVGIVAVKEALTEACGDEEKAIEILRKKGQAQAVKKAEREQSEGGIFISKNNSKAALVFLKCETDFVGRSDGFLKLGQELADLLLAKGGKEFQTLAAEKIPAAVLEFGENISLGESHVLEAPVIGTYVHSNRKIGVIVGLDTGSGEAATDAAMHAAAMNPSFVTPEEVSAEAVKKEREIWTEQMKSDKKPPEIQEKIMLGKERKFREENALISQPFVKDPSKTVGQMLAGSSVTTFLRVGI